MKLPKVRLEFRKNSFYYQRAKLFNELPIASGSLTSREFYL